MGGGAGSFGSNTETAPAVGGGTTDDSTGSTSSGPGFQGNEDVDVVTQSSIGPYQAVTIRASGTQGISEWLTTNGFAIPASIVPVIDGYTLQKFDFIALRLRPNQGVRAMRPVRIVTPGADTTLPLRMVAAGVGAKVGLTLWVIGEGRYHTQNFPDAPIDWSQLAWDPLQGRSNRTQLETAALASGGGRGWITEAVVRSSFTESKWGYGLPNAYDAYQQTCQFRPKRTVPCDETALPPADGKPADVTPDDPDGGAPDGGGAEEDGGEGGDASADAGASDAATTDGGDPGTKCTKVVSACDGFDDLAVAARSLHAGDGTITRLRADLPVAALATDLRLEASPDQSLLSPVHKTTTFTVPGYSPCPKSTSTSSSTADDADDSGGSSSSRDSGCACRSAPLKDGAGTWLVIGLTCIVLPLVTRRRRS